MDEVSQTSQWKFALFVGLIAFVVTAVFTYPLLFNLNTHIVGFWGSDATNHAWSAWWYYKSIFVLNQSPANLTHIYYPTLVYHPLVTAASWSKIVALPFMFISSPITIYNSHLFISYILTWVFTSLLCLELTNNKIAALIGGAIFTFSVNHTAHAFYGHFTQTLTYSYPLLVLAFWRLMKNPIIKNGILLGLAMSMVALLDLMPLAYFGIPMVIGLLLYFFTQQRNRMFSKAGLTSLGTAVLVAILIVMPFMWPLLSQELQGNLDWYQSAGSGDFSADLVAIFLPPPGHPLANLWPALKETSDAVYSFGLSRFEGMVYAGWVCLTLAGIGLVKKWEARRDVRLWFLLAVICAILTLGPLLRINGQLISINKTPILLPYALFLKIPFLSWGRTPARFNGVVMFALAVLAAYGVSFILEKLKTRWHKFSLASVLLTLILLDSVVLFPWPMMDTTPPPVFAEIAADKRHVAVLDLPVLDYSAAKFHLLYQMTHQHALVGGFRIRRPDEAAVVMQSLEQSALPGGDVTGLAENSIAYVTIHHEFYSDRELREMVNNLEDQVGKPIFSDDTVTVFAIPNANEFASLPLNAK